MLPMSKVYEVERLLAEGRLSQRKIARATGVSRGVISQIAQGKRPDYSDRLHDEDDALRPTGEIARCPTCGARVYMPCRLCHVRQMQAGEAVVIGRLRKRARMRRARQVLAAVLDAKSDDSSRADAPSDACVRTASQPPELPPPVA